MDQKNKITIYALFNPISNAIFYIGASEYPEVRLYSHITSRNIEKNYKSEIIRRIFDAGLKPSLIELDECNISEAWFWEEFYIDLFLSFGFTLKQSRLSGYKKSTTPSIIYPRLSVIEKNGFVTAKVESRIGGYGMRDKVKISSIDFNDDTTKELLDIHNKRFSQELTLRKYAALQS